MCRSGNPRDIFFQISDLNTGALGELDSKWLGSPENMNEKLMGSGSTTLVIGLPAPPWPPAEDGEV